MTSIVVITGKSRGFSIPLGPDTVEIGRDEHADLQVLDDLVSRKHLQIRIDESSDGHVAVDEHSANGVFVNGLRIDCPTPLHDNDVIQIGETKLIYSLRRFDDTADAMEFFKLRGEHDRSTVVVARKPKDAM